MKVLVLNGSPKKKSDTFRLTEAFLRGFNREKKHEVHIINVIEKDIAPCRGCFGCWQRLDGHCVIQDDQNAILDLYRTADRLSRYTERQQAYLAATARPMMDALKTRGITVHFATMNGMAAGRPKSDILIARKFWNDCGFFFFETVSYPDRKIALHHMAGKLKEIGKVSYVMMIPDGNKTEFKPFYESVGSQGIMSFFKSQPPEDGAFKAYPFRPGNG